MVLVATNWQAVAEVISQRLVTKGWSKAELARRSGVSEKTIHDLTSPKDGRNFSPSTLGVVSQALGWPAGTLEEVSNGGAPPVEVSPSDLAERVGDTLRLLAGVTERLSTLAQRIESLEQQTAARFESLGRRLDALEQ